MTKLTEKTLPALSRIPGRHPVAGALGLKLKVIDGGARAYWTYRFRLNGKGNEISLGAFPDIGTIKDAKALHADAYAKVKNGVDPRAEKHARKAAVGAAVNAMPTFGEAAERYIADNEKRWSNPKNGHQWRVTLLGPEGPGSRNRAPRPDHCFSLRAVPIDKITRAMIIDVLTPIWKTAPVTMRRVRGRIEMVLDAAYVRLEIEDKIPNPARWKGKLDQIFVVSKTSVKRHHDALPYAEVPTFVRRLRARGGKHYRAYNDIAAAALEFLVLTAARSGEVRGMVWDEVNLKDAVWTVRAERMKARKLHRVPLSDRALEILKQQYEARGNNPYVFPGLLPGKPLSKAAFDTLRGRFAGNITAHGFRSSFRDWAGDETHFPREVIEQALAHTIGGVEGDYRRSDAFKKRRELMGAWAMYCASAKPIAIARAGA
jgi:integrase